MRKKKSYEYSREGVKQSVLRAAKSARIEDGWANQIAERAAKAADTWIADKNIVTEADLRKVIAKELEEVAPDVAFAYKNHGKII